MAGATLHFLRVDGMMPPLKNKPMAVFQSSTEIYKEKHWNPILSFKSSAFFCPFSKQRSFLLNFLAHVFCALCMGLWWANTRHTWRTKVVWMRNGQERNSLWTLFIINMGIYLQMKDLKHSNKGKSISHSQLHWHTLHPEGSWLMYKNMVDNTKKEKKNPTKQKYYM